jgi:uncharacterized protein YfaS (alpha-2-macroglobulin family)
MSQTITISLGNCMRVKLALKDFNGQLITNCTNHIIQLIKPDGTRKESDYTSPTNNGDGTYTQDLFIELTDPTGVWSIDWQITYNDLPSRVLMVFRVSS